MNSVCPFCKSAVPSAGPCPACGRLASDHPSVQMGGGNLESSWGDDDSDDGGLDLSRGGSVAGPNAGPSAYGGGGMSFGDDDPFAEDAPDGALELDIPAHHIASAPRVVPAGPAPPSVGHPGAGSPVSPPGSVPDLVLPAGRPSGTMQSPLTPGNGPPPAARSEPSSPLQPPPSEPSLPPWGQHEPPVQAAAARPAEPPRPPDPASLIARYPDPPVKVWEAPIYALRVLWRQFELHQDLASLRKKRSPDVPLYERALKTHDAKAFALGLAITCAGLAFASFIFFLPVILRFLRDPD